MAGPHGVTVNSAAPGFVRSNQVSLLTPGLTGYRVGCVLLSRDGFMMLIATLRIQRSNGTRIQTTFKKPLSTARQCVGWVLQVFWCACVCVCVCVCVCTCARADYFIVQQPISIPKNLNAFETYV